MRCTTPPAPLRRRLVRFPPAGILCTSCWGRSWRAVDFSGSLKRSVRSGPKSAQQSGHGSVRSGQWSRESLFSLANGGQSLFGLSGQKWSKSVRSGQYLSLANTFFILFRRPKAASIFLSRFNFIV